MSIETVGVIGAGIMGNGIAQVCAAAGLSVVMVDINQEAVDRGIGRITESLNRFEKKGQLAEGGAAEILARISGTPDYDALAPVGLVIESATERQEIKVKILKQVDGIVAPSAIISSNTSSISITELAATNSDPSRVIGMHFFNPPALMALVEIIRGLQTSDETHAAVREVANRVGKKPISVKNNPGFVVNRILVPMINEAFFVLAEGVASAEEIDIGMKLGCNQPIGPLALGDMIGLDTCLAILEVFRDGFEDPKYRPCPLLREFVAAGRLGRKTGRGVYSYQS